MVKTIRTQHDIIHYPDVQNFTAYQHIISLLEFGHTHDSKGYYLSRETCPYAVFFYCGTGSGKIIYQGKNMYFTKGDTIILPAGTSHILISDPDDPFLVKWINASGPAVDNLMNTYDIFAPTVYPQVDTSGLITSYHASIESSLDAKEIISNTILLLTAIVHTCALPDASSISQKSSLAQMIKTCIDHHIQDSDLSVSKIADMLEIRCQS
jgi:hypothetical protein